MELSLTATIAKSLSKRQECYEYANGTVRCYNSAWDNWARWLVLALIIVAAFLLFFTFSCISARRRRKMGYAPYRGTGWAAGRHGPVQYNQQPHYGNQQPYYNNSNNPAPPAYAPPPNQGYYGGQNNSYHRANDVELQQPANTYGGGYRGEAGVYEPPKGPPPGRS
ncbi:hypothetical protein AC579_4968 [Pseudocercospora musae]|uniref:Uncharacterized protein n=1 Tax=Pseudocercospora musae TaxID=113226 RepID=A0A139HKY4_9PEZI|nr:hypothetical protein AC579_4968 [Pseudocercospora musae]KXT03167.1 hypothetical protein AC579_4968 [Pseudocercospora musae]